MCKGPVTGEIVVRENRRGYDVIQIISDNAEIKEKLKEKKLPQTMRLKIDVDGGFQAPVIMHLPSNYDPRCQFYHHSISFCASRSQKRKNILTA